MMATNKDPKQMDPKFTVSALIRVGRVARIWLLKYLPLAEWEQGCACLSPLAQHTT